MTMSPDLVLCHLPLYLCCFGGCYFIVLHPESLHSFSDPFPCILHYTTNRIMHGHLSYIIEFIFLWQVQVNSTSFGLYWKQFHLTSPDTLIHSSGVGFKDALDVANKLLQNTTPIQLPRTISNLAKD